MATKKINNEDMQCFAAVTSSGLTVPSIIDKKSSRPYILWGEDNKLTNYLWDSYLKNSNLQAILNTMMQYIVGEGIDHTFERNASFINEIKKCIFDYILFGGFALEGIRNAKGEIVRLNYINVMNIRVNEELTSAYISNNWGQWSGKDIIELPLFNKNDRQPHFIYFYRGNITRNIYPVPMYIGALKSIEILNNTRNFHLNNLLNNFSVNAIINLNNGSIKKRELEEIKAQLEEQYTGTNNAGKFLLINGGDKEHAATIERLQADSFGDLYKALDESSKDDIYTAFRINPILLGKNVSTGFSKQEFQEAYILYSSTVINPIKNEIKDAFDELGIVLLFKDFKINWTE